MVSGLILSFWRIERQRDMNRPAADTSAVINFRKSHSLKAVSLFGLLAAIFLLTGCFQTRTVKPEPPVAKPAPQVTEIDRLLSTAENFEKQGQYLEAKQQCEDALEIDSRESRALECKTRLDGTLRRLADEKVGNGIAMAKKGKLDAANQMFLEALHLWPIHEQALRQIGRNHPLAQTPFILHKLKSGSNLTTLALKYYGNSLYYPIIAEFNQIKQDSKVKAGERLRIPKIKGLPLNTHGASLKTVTLAERKVAAYRVQGMNDIKAGNFKRAIARLKRALRMDKDDLATRQQLASAYHGLGEQLFEKKAYARARDQFRKGLKIDPNCTPCQEGIARYQRTIADKHITEARRLFKADQFKAAVAELEKARKLVVDDREIDNIISEAHYQKAKGLCAIDAFQEAREQFELAAKFNPQRFSDHDYERQCHDAYLEIHYNLGNNYYQNGRPQDAIAEWNKVSALDPDYKAVRYNVDLARLLMESDQH